MFFRYHILNSTYVSAFQQNHFTALGLKHFLLSSIYLHFSHHLHQSIDHHHIMSCFPEPTWWQWCCRWNTRSWQIQLDRLDHTAFYWVYFLMILLVIVFIYYIIYVKLLFYIHVCNSYLILSTHCLLKSVNMILMTDIFKKDLLILKNIYSIFSDEVHFIWINQDLSALLKKI